MSKAKMDNEAIIFDIDGTLCDVSSIRMCVEGPNADFDEFHRRSVDCLPIQWVKEAAIEAARGGFQVIQVTARQEKYRALTGFWLAMHKIPSEALYMRTNGDFRPDYEVKCDILSQIKDKYNIVKAYDDNPTIVEMWSENNIPCVVVPGWSPNVKTK